jgi:hypothetical protein
MIDMCSWCHCSFREKGSIYCWGCKDDGEAMDNDWLKDNGLMRCKECNGDGFLCVDCKKAMSQCVCGEDDLDNQTDTEECTTCEGAGAVANETD